MNIVVYTVVKIVAIIVVNVEGNIVVITHAKISYLIYGIVNT